MYLLGALQAGGAALSPETLISLGALRLPLASFADAPRLLGAALVHVDAQHLLSNVVLLLALGAWPGALEQRLGRPALLALFFLGALCGSVAAALLYRDEPTVVAGASGALLAIAGAGAAAKGPRTLRLFCAAACLLLLGTGLVLGDRTAGAAHLGGLLMGVVWATARAHPAP